MAGNCCCLGLGCAVNSKKAFIYYKNAYKKNNDAKCNYALMLLTGNGCKQRIKKGKQLLIDSFLKGLKEAELLILRFRITGELGWEVGNGGVSAAVSRLEKLGEEEIPSALFMLGVFYFEGTERLIQDEKLGLSILQKASNAGDEKATNYLKKLYGEDEGEG